MEQLLKQLKSIFHLSEDAQTALTDCLEEKDVAKGDFLITEGKICRYLYFLQKGSVRGYYNLEGKEVTHWFGFENDFVTSFYSFNTEQPAVENIQLMEAGVLWRISKEDLTGLFDQYQEIERLVRIAYEKYYIRLEERYVNSQFRTAAERYENLFQKTPHIIERVPLGYIASYLGISQETLSRIRGKI
jgi:CRP-like cAMP-binding protein